MKSARSYAEQVLGLSNVAGIEALIREYGDARAVQMRRACAASVAYVDLYGECHEASAYTCEDAFRAVLTTPLPEETGEQE